MVVFYSEKLANKDAGSGFHPSGIFICYTADFLIDDRDKYKLGVCLARSIPLPEVVFKRRIKKVVADITNAIA
jgi:hypothetical protein